MTESTIDRASSTSEPADASRRLLFQQIFIGLFCVALSVAAYKCVVLKTFLGDDHVHLVWLRNAVIHPDLVLRNFYSNWMYAGTSPQCYRPIISVFMFTDYLLWHHNAVGFHITNLLFHLGCCVGLYGCVREVLRWSSKNTWLKVWPVLAAGTFALYPSHPEAVSWVTGRVDTIVTAFYLASVYSYMLWRRTDRRKFFFCSLVFMLLSLGSKEMAVTIPAVFALFEILRPKNAVADAGFESKKNDTDNAVPARRLDLSVLKFTAPAWCVLVAYFLLRRFALGTFIGGYDDSLAVSVSLLYQQWSAGLSKFFVPINAYYATENNSLVWTWISLIVPIYVASIIFLSNQKHRNQILFFMAFAVVSFAPVYKLFNGVPDLQGSRFSYLASAPLAALFAFGLASVPALFRVRKANFSILIQTAISVIYFSTAALTLWVNNQPWMVAGRWVSGLEKGFNASMSGATRSDGYVYFNIPNNYRGAYLARNAIGDIGGHSDVDWTAIEPDDRYSETGQIRQKITDGKKRMHSYFWNDNAGAFIPIELPPVPRALRPSAWNFLPLTKKFRVIQGAQRITPERTQSTQGLINIEPGMVPLMMAINLSQLSSWDVEFLQLNMMDTERSASVQDSDVSLIISDSLLPTTVIKPTISQPRADLKNLSGVKSLLFSMRTIPGWFCSTDKAAAILVFPPAWRGSFSLTIPDESRLMPYLSRTSIKHVITPQSPEQFKIDVSRVPGAVGALLQLSQKNKCFSSQNTYDFENKLSGKIIAVNSITTETSLAFSDLPGEGQYQVRCWAVGKDGQTLGVGSDYIYIVAQRSE